MSERLKRFTDLMQEIFELDKSDLDFGIYRIMNIRKAEIEKFLTQRLPELVQETLKPFAQDDKSAIRNRMSEIEQALGDLSAIPDSVPMKAEYINLQKQLAQGVDLSALETDVYSALYSFFNRYYEEGDFISKRRYKEGVYAIPYEGEEVKLYWANQDQYYIKTSENFKDYSFTVGEYTVHFRLVDATTEQNNNKESKDKKRVFMLFTEDEDNYPGIKTFEYNEEAKELIIRFIFDIPDDKKKKYDELNYAAISDWLVKNRIPMWQDLLVRNIPSGKNGKMIDLLEKHLKGYIAKNTFDYFIHKDLRGFLSRELDFYIKSEVMHLDDLDTDHEEQVEAYLAKVKAIKRVGKIIIDFLAQIEDFQKKLWLKKKFVVETNWCMTLDMVDESFWQEITENQDQIKEWIALYAIDEAEGWTNPPSVDFLHANQNLVIDTKHFSNAFKEKLVASIENLDEQTNGLMVCSDNLQALNLLQSKHSNHASVILIDPPYNTGEDDFLYKDGYQSSSWLTMVSERINKGMEFLEPNGIMQICTSDEEQEILASFLRDAFGKERYFANLIWEKKKKGSFLSGKIARMKDYIACVLKQPELFEGLIGEIVTEDETYPCVNASNPRDVRIITHELSSKYKEKDYRLVAGSIISAGNMNLKLISDLIIQDGKLVPPLIIEGNWRYSQQSMDEYAEQGDLYLTQDLYLRRIVHEPREKRLKDLLLRTSDSDSFDFRKIDLNDLSRNGWGSNEDANEELLQIMGKQYIMSYPKPVKLFAQLMCATRIGDGIFMDYFAGAGTLAMAIMMLYRIDFIWRKYVLVDSGAFFTNVTKERIMKGAYSADWSMGKPQNRNTGVSQIIKYMTLESYEDALSNIRLDDEVHGMFGLFKDDYMIHYMLDLESSGSLLNLDAFRDPFSYQMKITEKNECKERPVDVIETFNYLIGLTVTHQGATVSFTARPDANGEYEGAVELVKDIYGQYSFRQIEGTLPDSRRALVIWRTVNDNIIESNAALDAYFAKYRINPADREYDVIFVNGDNNLENLRSGEEAWKVQMTELEFKARMFEEE